MSRHSIKFRRGGDDGKIIDFANLDFSDCGILRF